MGVTGCCRYNNYCGTIVHQCWGCGYNNYSLIVKTTNVVRLFLVHVLIIMNVKWIYIISITSKILLNSMDVDTHKYTYPSIRCNQVFINITILFEFNTIFISCSLQECVHVVLFTV